ncbi:MAG: hypothetical protein AAF799_26440 [Myxococcota bacterium]
MTHSRDDAEEKTNGKMYLTSSDLELVEDAIHDTDSVGVRFTNISIPRGASIEHAYVQFTADEKHSGSTSLVIRAHDTNDAGRFTTAKYNLSGRSLTDASVNWNPSAWNTKNVATPNERTPDLSEVIQEVIDRPGWNSGNDLALVITGSGRRTADSYDGSSSKAPLLHIEYKNPGSGGGDGGSYEGEIFYENDGDVNEHRSNTTVSSVADAGDYEIVALGASDGGGNSLKNIPLDRDLMEDQDFELVAVRGTKDKKAEIWFRRNDGSNSQRTIELTGNANDVAWSVTTVEGSGLELDIDDFTTETHIGSHSNESTAVLETPSGDGFTFVVFFFDDSVELEDAGEGEILFKTWGHGDGDGMATVLYQADQEPPRVGEVEVDDHDGSSGGEQYVTVAFKSNH